jgi:hypothetical protein
VLGEAIGRLVGTLLVPFVVMLVVGGIYYLIRRPRVTFWGAVFRWWVVLIGVIVLLLGLLGQAVNNLSSASWYGPSWGATGLAQASTSRIEYRPGSAVATNAAALRAPTAKVRRERARWTTSTSSPDP